jgi:methylaspartate ammonia-lyase
MPRPAEFASEVALVVQDIISAVGRSGYFNKDLTAIKRGPVADGFAYRGDPVSPGFRQIVQPLR